MEFIINIDTRKKAGIELIKFLKSLSFVKIKEKNKTETEKKPSALLISAVENVKNNKNLIVMNGKDSLSKFIINEL